MDSIPLISALLSTETPRLPSPALARLYLSLAWGLVLATLALGLLQRPALAGGRWHRGLPLALVLWCLLPGAASPAYWLGLAFRAPSTLLLLLCAWGLWRHYRPQVPALPLEAMRRSAWVLVLLGWLLLLDTFAVLPFSLYAAGFAPWVLAVAVMLGLLPWLLHGAGRWSALLLGACVLYVALRLPTGNLWDALLDPWLWLFLQADALRRWFKRV